MLSHPLRTDRGVRVQNRLAPPLPALKSPSGMKNAPTVMPTSTRNLKNQKLRNEKGE